MLLLELEPVLADEDGRRKKEYAVEDGRHISDAGYAALTSHSAAFLEEYLRSVR